MDNGFGNREGDMTFSRKRETIGQLIFTINRSENKILLWWVRLGYNLLNRRRGVKRAAKGLKKQKSEAITLII